MKHGQYKVVKHVNMHIERTSLEPTHFYSRRSDSIRGYIRPSVRPSACHAFDFGPSICNLWPCIRPWVKTEVPRNEIKTVTEERAARPIIVTILSPLIASDVLRSLRNMNMDAFGVYEQAYWSNSPESESESRYQDIVGKIRQNVNRCLNFDGRRKAPFLRLFLLYAGP